MSSAWCSDTITGLAGNDLLIGGTGGDTYVFGAGFGNDIIQDVESGAGTDTSWDTVVFNAPITRANLLFSVSASQPGDLIIGVRNTTDTVTVRNFFDSDTAGVERIEVDLYTSITRDQILDMFSIIGTAGADVLNAPATGGRLRGLGGNDVLNGGAGADYLDGGADVDQMVGVGGNDRYIVENLGDVVSEQGGSGIDRVDSSVTFTLSEGVENLTLVGSASVNGFGNALSNILIGNAGDNRLDGGAGADMLHGGSGSDIYVIDDVNDQIVEDSYHTDRVESYISFTLGEMLENLTLLGNASINGTGNAGQNILIGNAGNNMLDGGAGNDSMHGGAGDDTFTVQDTDTVTEGANEGTDTVRAADTFTLGSNIENLVLTGIGSSWATGNELDNSLTGNSGSNRLDGRADADRMTGSLGDDSYVIDNVGDVVVELQGEGYDVISSYLSLVLPEHFEGLTLQNNGSHLNATGNAANNQLIGNWSDNILDGGAGMDMMFGQDGADTYLVDNVADICEDDGFSGIDTVRSTVTYTLSTGIENLVLLGTGAMNGTGNALNNDITGTSADNILDGGSGGIDVLRGGLGNDFYRVTHTSSQVIEQGSEGSDTVESTATFTLGSHIENLTLTGTGNINGTGNDLDNSIIGNAGTNTLTGGAGNDRLDGGDGRDTMLGGTGNDTFVFRQSNDAATEAANEGTDTVEAYVTVASLGTNLENLTLMGSDAINGTGNAAANVVRGNAGANTLSGGTGSDTLIGGNGADIYTFTTAFGSETIDNASTDTAQDRLNFTNLQRSQVTFTRSGNDLVMTRNGTTTDNVRVSNWFSAAGNQLDFVQFTNQTLTAAQVNALFPTLAQVDETDLAVTRIVDAINHFDAVDQRITVDNEVHATTPWSLQLAGATVERWSVDHTTTWRGTLAEATPKA